MEPISLENLIPQESSFELLIGDKKETFAIRPVSLADEIFLKNEMKGTLETLQTDNAQLCRFVYRLMTEESKLKLSKRQVEFMDEEGESFKTELGGVKLFLTLVRGPSTVLAIKESLLMAFGVSREKLEELKQEAQKKTATLVAEMERKQAQQTGQESLTLSQVNTAGAQNTSSQEPEQKSPGALSA